MATTKRCNVELTPEVNITVEKLLLGLKGQALIAPETKANALAFLLERVIVHKESAQAVLSRYPV